MLGHAGRCVTIFEKNERVGGKLNWLEEGGYTWDMGPSLLTMPHVFEDLWRKLGRCLSDDLTLLPLPVTCRYRWTDGTVIDEDAAFWQRPDVARFLAYARGLYDLSADAFLHHPLGDWWRQLSLRNLPKLRHLPKIASFQTMDQVVRRSFRARPAPRPALRPFRHLQRFVALPNPRRLQHHSLRGGKVRRLVRQGRSLRNCPRPGTHLS